DERLAPRGEQHADHISGATADPRDEAFEALAVVGEFGRAFRALGERAVVARVVATGERPAVEDREVHFASYSSIRLRTRVEKNHGPSASDRSNPSGVGSHRVPS